LPHEILCPLRKFELFAMLIRADSHADLDRHIRAYQRDPRLIFVGRPKMTNFAARKEIDSKYGE
jgi:hypothetical protein